MEQQMNVFAMIRRTAAEKRAAILAGAVAVGVGSLTTVGHAATVQQVGDVFYIALENHNFTQPNGNVDAMSTTIEQVKGNPAAPFLNSLITPGNPNAAQASYSTAYHNVLATPSGKNSSIHPSEPNYVWQEGGSNFGITNDNDPYAATGGTAALVGNHPSLSGLLSQKGVSWKSYQEDTQLTPNGGTVNHPTAASLTSTVAPQNQWTVPLSSYSGTSAAYTNPYNGSHQYDYAAKHAGPLFFADANGNGDMTTTNPAIPHYAPLQQLATDLTNNTVARYNWITPDQFNDMHSALTTDFVYNGVTYKAGTDAQKIAMGDNFLSKIVPLIQASAAYKNNGAIVIWNDEVEPQNSTDTAQNDFSHTSTEIVLSPLAKGNAFASSVNLTHSSDLLALQELFGVVAPGTAYLGDAGTPGTNDLSDLFVAGAFPAASAVPLPPAVWTGAGVMGILGLAMLRRRSTQVA
jgi:hypothetical protein